jgi:hypothetical protein
MNLFEMGAVKVALYGIGRHFDERFRSLGGLEPV